MTIHQFRTRAHQSYEPPPAPYRPGQKLRIGGSTYKVISSTHTHTQLEGIHYAVANWAIAQLKKEARDWVRAELEAETENLSLRKNTEQTNSPDRYISKESPTDSTNHKGRYPTGSDLIFFLGVSPCLNLRYGLVVQFSS